MIVDYIDAHRNRIVEGKKLGVEPIRQALREAGVQIAPSSYYATKTREPSARSVRDAALVTDCRVPGLMEALVCFFEDRATYAER